MRNIARIWIFVTICIFYLISCTYLWTRFLPSKSEQTTSGVFSDNACSCSLHEPVVWHVTVSHTSHESRETRHAMRQNYKLDIMVKQIKLFARNQTAHWVLKCNVGIHRDAPGGPPCPSAPLILSVMSRVWQIKALQMAARDIRAASPHPLELLLLTA